MAATIGQSAEAAIARAFAELATAPGYKGAVILYLTPDTMGLSIKSNLPGHLVELLIREAWAFTTGARGRTIVVAKS